MRTLASTSGIAAIAILFAMPAALGATANRTWVSHSGTVGNAALSPPCTATNPCDTFATALGVTNVGGEINCVDNGSYGAVTITQSVTIDCGGQLGAIDPTSGNAITVNGSGIVVTLRNLTLNGANDASLNPIGVQITNAATVTIEHCVIENFINGSASVGIALTPGAAIQMNVSDALVVHNSNGVSVAPTAGAVDFTLDRVRLDSNGIGLGVNGSGSSGTIKGFIRESVVAGSASTGIGVTTTTAATALSVYRTHAVGNNTAVAANNGAAALLDGSTIQANATALNSVGGGVIFSYGNNAINDNDAFGSTPTVIALH